MMVHYGLQHLQTMVDPIPRLKTVRTKFIHLWKENIKKIYNPASTRYVLITEDLTFPGFIGAL